MIVVVVLYYSTYYIIVSLSMSIRCFHYESNIWTYKGAAHMTKVKKLYLGDHYI